MTVAVLSTESLDTLLTRNGWTRIQILYGDCAMAGNRGSRESECFLLQSIKFIVLPA